MSGRGWLYRAARLWGDVDAALKGPVPFVRRRVRARGYATVNGLLARLFRRTGL